MRCDECLFYSNTSAACRARPPRVGLDLASAVWPPMPAGGWCGAWTDDQELRSWRRELRNMMWYEEQGKVPVGDREEFDRRVEQLKGFIAERVSR